MVACRRGTLALVADLGDDTLRAQLHPDFSPIGWHLGHIAFTEAHWLLGRCCGVAVPEPQWNELFHAEGLPKPLRRKLPDTRALYGYLADVRGRVFAYLEEAPVEQQMGIWKFVLQHESQHDETIAVLRRLADLDLGVEPLPGAETAGLDDTLVTVPGGEYLLGSDEPDALDNERPAYAATVAAFAIERYPVTQARFRKFIEADGYRTRDYWSEEGWAWRERSGTVRPLYWRTGLDDRPVCGVSHYEAEAFCRFVGRRLPSEQEWECAAGAPLAGREAGPYPWGKAAPSVRTCNFDGRRGWVSPVTSHEAGASPYRCADMLGNTWEWTATRFAPHAGFSPYPYEGYSQNYFDGRHYVMRGGSWATRPWVLRRSFRNWYLPHLRELFVGFRCAQDA